MGISIMTSPCDDKNSSLVTPVSVSLPVVETVNRTGLPLGQQKKTITASTSNQVHFQIHLFMLLLKICLLIRSPKLFLHLQAKISPGILYFLQCRHQPVG